MVVKNAPLCKGIFPSFFRHAHELSKPGGRREARRRGGKGARRQRGREGRERAVALSHGGLIDDRKGLFGELSGRVQRVPKAKKITGGCSSGV